MNAKDERDPKTPKSESDSREPRKRFRIEKLEERIAPSKGGKGTHNCGGGSAQTSSSSLSGGSIY